MQRGEPGSASGMTIKGGIGLPLRHQLHFTTCRSLRGAVYHTAGNSACSINVLGAPPLPRLARQAAAPFGPRRLPIQRGLDFAATAGGAREDRRYSEVSAAPRWQP